MSTNSESGNDDGTTWIALVDDADTVYWLDVRSLAGREVAPVEAPSPLSQADSSAGALGGSTSPLGDLPLPNPLR
jgi:hypothetical protein